MTSLHSLEQGSMDGDKENRWKAKAGKSRTYPGEIARFFVEKMTDANAADLASLARVLHGTRCLARTCIPTFIGFCEDCVECADSDGEERASAQGWVEAVKARILLRKRATLIDYYVIKENDIHASWITRELIMEMCNQDFRFDSTMSKEEAVQILDGTEYDDFSSMDYHPDFGDWVVEVHSWNRSWPPMWGGGPRC